jgi:glutamyl-tRNA synthetase
MKLFLFMKKDVIRAYVLKNAIEHEGKAIAGSVISGLFKEGLKKDKIKSVVKDVNKIINEVNKLSLDRQKEEFDGLSKLVGKRKEREGLPKLDKSSKGVITRFSPSASGPMHIGHVLTAGPAYLYVKKFGGKFYFRIEDTNPDNIYKKSYKMLEDEAKWLFEKPIVMIQSERMELYYKYLKKLFDLEKIYVCDCNPDEFKRLIIDEKACKCRGLGKDENLKRWNMMLKNEYKQGEAVVRFKSNLKDKNPAMRDFPLARINTNSHPLQDKKYKVWPLMNLAVSVDDMESKITHIIRGKDHKDNAKRQEMIFKVFKKKYPVSIFIGRLHFKDLELSTSKMREGIENGKYKGWDDSKLLTVSSLKKKGYVPEVFWKFVEQRGLSEVDKVMSKDDFYKLLDDFGKKDK